MKNKSCKDCEFMKAKFPIENGKFIYKKAKAVCVNESGVLNNQNKVFNVGLVEDNFDYLDWKLYGEICRQYQE